MGSPGNKSLLATHVSNPETLQQCQVLFSGHPTRIYGLYQLIHFRLSKGALPLRYKKNRVHRSGDDRMDPGNFRNQYIQWVFVGTSAPTCTQQELKSIQAIKDQTVASACKLRNSR